MDEGREGPRGVMPAQRMKMNFPKFKGGEALEWIEKVEMFFTDQETPVDQWVQLATYHLDDEAYQWTQWFQKRRGRVGWKSFVEGFSARFGPLEYEDFDALLSKLRQIGSVAEYKAKFERLANRVNWEDKTLLGCFTSRLKDHKRDEVLAYQPHSLAQVINLARLQEEKFSRRRASYMVRSSTTSTIGEGSNQKNQVNNSGGGKTIVKRLNHAKEQERRAKGLCFNYDEKFTPDTSVKIHNSSCYAMRRKKK